MKIALIADTHAGARQDSLVFDAYFKKFFDEVFFPYLVENEIDTVVHLGDIFDRRKFINFKILSNFKEYFIKPLAEHGITLHLIKGNHDVFYKDTNEVSGPEMFLSEYDNVVIYDKPAMLEDTNIALIPWINRTNDAEIYDFLNESTADIVMGHFEFKGFEVLRGVKIDHGMQRNVFKKFKRVFSGHFHHKQTKGNITYVGSPYQITFADMNDKKGFHIFDTETSRLKFVENPNHIFHSISYNDTVDEYERITDEDFSYLQGTHLKIIIESKTNPYIFDRFMDAMENASPANITIVEDLRDYNLDDDDIENIMSEDTTTLITNRVDNLDIKGIDKNRLKGFLKGLYVESLE